MKKLINKQNEKLRIYLESDHLIMYGSSTESSGCVLRGVLSLKLNKPTRYKLLSLNFMGKISVSWNQLGNGYERKFFDSRVVISQTWMFLPPQNKLHLLSKGTYTFDFELVLPGDLPESIIMKKCYNVDYQLKAVAEKSAFSKDLVVRQDIHLSRQRSNITHAFFDPVLVSGQWEDKLAYDISLPTKVYTYGNHIPIKIKMNALIPNLHVRYISCAFKEHFVCRAVNGWFNGKTKSQRRLIEYIRKGMDCYELPLESTWSTTLFMQVPLTEIQCDAHNDSVRVWHTITLNMSIEEGGSVYDIKIVSPIIIAITDSIGVLPSYEDIWQTLPYEPLSILIPNNPV